MRNLFLFLRTYYRFFVFLVIELICLAVFFTNNSYQNSSYVHSARSLTGSVYEKRQKFAAYLTLRDRNDSLLKENARLLGQLGTKQKKNPLKDTSYSLLLAEDSVKQTIYFTYHPARVLNNSIDRKNNFITLDKGRKDNIRKNMSVVTAKGVVGKITHVSDQYALASSILSSGFNISCKTPKGSLGTASWDSEFDADYLVLNGISQSEKLKKGDSIITSGFSLFPKNILIGRVVGSDNKGSTGMPRYKVKLSINFRRLNFVYIVEDKTTFDRKILEDSVKTLLDE